MLLNLRTRNTDMLLGAVAKVLSDEGIELISSTAFLEPLLAQEGVLTKRAPDEEERKNIDYGLSVARSVAGFDIGQTVVVAAQACVAVEAMEGTDAAIERAGALMRTMDEDASTLERRLTVVKVAKPKQDMRFDVPVIGVRTVETMIAAGAACLSVEAGRTLLFDREALVERANESGIAIGGGAAVGRNIKCDGRRNMSTRVAKIFWRRDQPVARHAGRCCAGPGQCSVAAGRMDAQTDPGSPAGFGRQQSAAVCARAGHRWIICVGPGYAQDAWVAAHGYAHLAWKTLVEWWNVEHNILMAVVERIPEERMKALCTVGNDSPVTLRYLIEDYTRHQFHHFDQINAPLSGT